MERTGAIDHDEEDRDSSEYEEMDDEETAGYSEQRVVIDCQSGPSGVPVVINHDGLEYEEVYHTSESQLVVGEQMGPKVYYENEMEDLVIHEIFGNEHQKAVPRQVQNVVVETPSCSVCHRPSSEKTRLFRWPKPIELQEQWAHFFKMPLSALSMAQNLTICSFHFTADSFAVINDRIFWKASPVPKYRLRRPCVTDPFPWEAAAKEKMDEMRNDRRAQNAVQYRIRYRMPYNKHKSRASHPVAVLSPINQPHLFYEFHFNRQGLNNTKFYACLSCRKAKVESGIRDVIRTIHLDNTKLLSHDDPFCGHHFACRPHNVYDYRSSWRPVGPDADSQFEDDIVYVDERGNTIQWDNCSRSLPNAPECSKNQIFEEVVNLEEPFLVEEPVYQEENPPVLETLQPVNAFTIENEPVINNRRKRIPSSYTKKLLNLKCHLCLKRGFQSTALYASHLQQHVTNEKDCQKCGIRISCDDAPILIRRRICKHCWNSS